MALVSISRLILAGVFCLALATLTAGGQAATVKEIDWKSLLPNAEPLKNPLNSLTQDQQFNIETIIWARSMSAEERELKYNKSSVEDAAKYERQFAKAGISLDKLLQDYKAWRQEVERRQQLVNDGLNGKTIRLAGYLLPIEFSEKGQKDYLLVPYVGACVHVPPPPANQIVYVRLAQTLVVNDLFTPVWIEGQLKTKQSSKSLNLSDGNRKILVGYRIDGASLKPYKQ